MQPWHRGEVCTAALHSLACHDFVCLGACAGAAAALQPITEHAPKVGMAMIRAISERVLMGGDDDAADEDALYAETPARWKPSAAEIAHLDVCTLGPEGCAFGSLSAWTC